MSKKAKEYLLIKKLTYTIGILCIYVLGRCIHMYGVDTEAAGVFTPDAESMLKQAIGGDLKQLSVFALGVTPYITSSMIVQIAISLLGSERRSKISQKTIKEIEFLFMIGMAVFMAGTGLNNLKFVEGCDIFFARIVCMLQMVTGAIVIYVMCERNKARGIGGQSPIITVNIAEGLIRVVTGYELSQLYFALLLGFAIILIMLFMELNTYKISMLRTSINNMYGDDNYLPIKYNPVGVMPVMFSTALFLLLRLLMELFCDIFDSNEMLADFTSQLNMETSVGIGIYILGIFLLTFLFARIMLNPSDIAEGLLKSGDCIENIRPGEPTKRYLRKKVLKMSLFSGTVLSVCIGLPLVLKILGKMDSAQSGLATSIAMLVGLICSIGQEIRAVIKSDSYKIFF